MEAPNKSDDEVATSVPGLARLLGTDRVGISLSPPPGALPNLIVADLTINLRVEDSVAAHDLTN